MDKSTKKTEIFEATFSSQKEECIYLRKKVEFLLEHSEKLARLVTQISSENITNFNSKGGFLYSINNASKVLIFKVITFVLGSHILKRIAEKFLNRYPKIKLKIKRIYRKLS
jgi:hypothetical protein